MESKKILAFVGMPGAGKSYCTDYLESKGIPSVYFGGIVVDEVKRRFGNITEAYEKQVREEFRAQDGMAAIAKRTIPKIDEILKTNDRVIADGLYSWSEYKMLKEHFGDAITVIAIAAPRKERHKRLATRPARPLSEQDVTSREYAEIENIEKGGPIANADYTIVNDSTPEDMINKLETILKEAHFL